MNKVFSAKDFYCVYNDYDISQRLKEINLLYLPLLGKDAVSLYFFLGNKMLSDKNLSKNYLHYDILDNLALTENKFIIARKKLEALGLLQSFYISSDEAGQLVYKIKDALSFSDFFNTPILSQLLENTLGSNEYKELLNYYSRDKVSFRSFEEITAKFSDVFRVENLSDYSFDYLSQNSYSGPNFDEYYFDFDKLNFYLANSYLSDVISDENVKIKILGLAHIYKMSPQDMAKAIEKSIEVSNGGNNINLKVLSDFLVQFNVNVRKQEIPTLDRMINKNFYNEDNGELSEEDKFIKEVDNTDFITYLNKQKGIVVSSIDARNITELQDKYNFPTGVLNILLEYSINQSGKDIIPHINYIDKIASTWSGQKLLGAKDAIEYVRNNRNYKKSTNVKSVKQKSNSSTIKKANYAPFPDYLQNRKNNFNGTKKSEDRIVTKEDEDAYNKMMQELNDKRDV
ncbi:DnaD domain protein [Gemella sp.]